MSARKKISPEMIRAGVDVFLSALDGGVPSDWVLAPLIVFDLYQAGRLDLIREYNLNDVRVTRKIYERMVSCFGR